MSEPSMIPTEWHEQEVAALKHRVAELEAEKYNAMAEWRECKKRALKREIRVAELEAWKKSAIAVTPDMQKIGKLIGVGLGESIHDKIVPWIEAALAVVEAARYLKKAMIEDFGEDVELSQEAQELFDTVDAFDAVGKEKDK